MKPVKRVEIITDSLELRSIVQMLDEIGVSGYTVLKDVVGKGGRGMREGDELTDVFKNSYILVACPEEQLEPIVNCIRPILKKFGGICLVSDALWLVH